MRKPTDVSTSDPELRAALITLDDLQALVPAGTDVVALLRALGVPHGGGLVPRLIFERALGLHQQAGATPDAPAIDVVRRLLARAGIVVSRAERSRGWTIELSAASEPRYIYNELHEERPRTWPAIDLPPGKSRTAKVYLASKRHLGAAHFLLSGLDDLPDDQVFVFVLVPDERVWLATARDLRMLQRAHDADDARAKKKLKMKFGRVGVTARRPGQPTKVWFPVGNTSFDAEHQIRDSRGVQVLALVGRGGGR